MRGTHLWLKSFEVTGCKITGCKKLEKNKGAFLSDFSQSLLTHPKDNQLVMNSSQLG
jgi:hypothetical protein